MSSILELVNGDLIRTVEDLGKVEKRIANVLEHGRFLRVPVRKGDQLVNVTHILRVREGKSRTPDDETSGDPA